MGENNNNNPTSDSPGAVTASGDPCLGSASPAQQLYTADYLSQLLKDKKQLAAFPNVFLHLERLIDEEIAKVRLSLFQFEFNKDVMVLPDGVGPIVTIQEKVYVPAKDYPDYNFVGRILGPRGMTAKQLEQETGCKIMVRGRGSMRDKKKEEMNRGKPNWEHLTDELHVLVQCEDSDNRAKPKMLRAVDEVRKLLVPAPEGEDELKRKQLMELAIINGTYRPANQSKIALQTPRLLTPMTLPSPMRSPTLGAPIILSPSRAPIGAPLTPTSSLANGFSPAGPQAAAFSAFSSSFMPNSPTADMTAGLYFNNPFADPSFASAAAAYPYASGLAALASPFLAGEYPTLDLSQAGAILKQHRLLGQLREHPYQRPSSLKTPTS